MNNIDKNKKQWWEIVATLTPLILGLSVTGTGVYFTQVYNYRNLQLNQIDTLNKFKQQLFSENDYDRQFAYAVFVSLGYKELAIKLIKSKDDPAGRAILQSIEQSSKGEIKTEATNALSTLPRIVYIQIANKEQNSTAEKIRTKLESMGLIVPGIENVAGKNLEIPSKTSVRYFSIQDQEIAEKIVNVLKEEGQKNAIAIRVTGFKVKPGSWEIWFAK